MRTGNKAAEWIIKRMDPAAMEDFNQLYTAVYHRKPPANYYNHKFGTALAGINYVGFLAYTPDGQPIASLCLVPCIISYGRERITGAQLTDGMTHPAYRKKGLFSELETYLINLAKDEAIDVLFGFAVPATNPLLINKGWYELEKTDRFVIPVPHSLKWFLQKSLRKIGLKKNSKAMEREPNFLNSVLADGFAGVERSKGYLIYKSFTNTGILKTTDGLAWIKIGDQLVIGDMEVKENDFDPMIRHIQSVAENAGAIQIYFQCSKGIGLHRLFSKQYAAIPSFSVVMKTLTPGIDTARIRFTFADVDIF
jgi:hypothetical protein